MKKQFLFLAGSAIILASCGSNNNQPAAPTAAQTDSAMNAKLAEHDAANAAKNDSTLKAIEKEKADAAMKEHHGEGKKHEGGKETKPATTPTVAPTPAPGGLRGHSDQTQNKTTTPNNATTTGKSGGGLRGHSDQNQGH